ncbi:UDP-N-acetylglucosamine:LPS N-acetylglucosamine transferase [Clostridium collagenovorans DSM 3089]|uniref:UDP-N-acetylglucosamine:LPS N-acetylglucosamine transferase n=1 Tax=Clostridium collagenovorans DSM 3089 TaxID=1121306 RepID=A0A1M5XH60_9CLOT|nr:glycosyltransferase [Clostridium collagenovorans]SHH98573.1 UDP-N-acetylglucosamine:LPS N-acetylglucosamine transferase [Clostridium collagenovorans DSM 3089]
MNILILTGSFGMGHNSSAIAIKQKLNKECLNSNCTIVDINKYIFPIIHPVIYMGFNIVVHKCHKIYNVLYKITEREIKIPLRIGFIRKIRRLLKIYTPDMIISTLPMSSKFISEYKKISNIEIPLITCATDISLHSDWINSKTDAYFVATEKNKKKLLQKGVKEENIYITGIPVREEFENQSEVLKETNKKSILIMGGGLGLIPLHDNLYEELSKLNNINIRVICGKNRKVFKSLYGKYSNIDVISYTDKISRYMREADMIISKAGGITLFEAIYSEIPIMVFKPFLEQEIENADFIENNGIGKVIKGDEKELLEEVKRLIYDENELLKMKNNMKSIMGELDSNKIVSLVDEFKDRREM